MRVTLFLLIFISFISSCSDKQEPSSKLEIADVFGENMVLQRNADIIVWGKAKENTIVYIDFNNQKVHGKTNNIGLWEIKLNKLKAGGPFEMKISSQDTIIKLKNILIGDVWLASGQSNMHLYMSRTATGKEDAKKANNNNVRLMCMKPTFPTGEGGIHTEEEIKAINNNKYFIYSEWKKADSSSVKFYPAVAYYFAEKLQEKLNIPIGIIHNAVPGSPIEAWLSKKVINADTSIQKFVENRWKDTTDIMINIAKKQIGMNTESKVYLNKNKHPWMPSYDYINGIDPIKKYAIKGVIWYQGESNAEYPKIYSTMFVDMVYSWRNTFNNNFPFYYVQLSSRGERSAWSKFRDMQRLMIDSIPNSAMVVCTDVGDIDDTHAKNKKPVGERLAILALGKTYGVGSDYQCPIFDKMTVENNVVNITFKGSFSSLKTLYNDSVVGFEISINKGVFKKVGAEINKEKIVIDIPKDKIKITEISIRYAWESFTDANLYSNNNMPVSTFQAKCILGKNN